MNAMLIAKKTLLSPEAYLAGEALAEIRHEYVAGEVYARAGASERHNRISGNLFFQLRAKARDSQCGVFMNDMKLRIEQGERFYYPDVMLVECRQGANSYTITANSSDV